MANWIPVTLNDLLNAKLAGLIEALQTKALADGQDDPTEQITANVVFAIRTSISSFAENVLDEDETTIPRDLLSLASRMVVREMQSRLQELLNADEVEEKKSDERLLERIEEGKRKVAAPDEPQATPEVQQSGGVQLVKRPCSRVSRETLKGL